MKLSFDLFTSAGIQLQTSWNSIRRKYCAAVNEGKTIESFQNSILKFLKPFIRQSKSKSTLVLATKPKEKDSEVVEDDVLVDNFSNSNSNDNSLFQCFDSPNSHGKENWTDREQTNPNLVQHSPSKTKDTVDVDEDHFDPYEEAIIKAFTTELKGKKI